MRRVKNINELKANIKEFAPFIRRLFLWVSIYLFFFSFLLAGCMQVSPDTALQIWLLVLPILWLLTNWGLLLARQVVKMLEKKLEKDIAPARLPGIKARMAQFNPLVPTSPPRLCLADRGASVCRH